MLNLAVHRRPATAAWQRSCSFGLMPQSQRLFFVFSSMCSLHFFLHSGRYSDATV